VNQWAALNHNPQWSAFHLLRAGHAVPGNAEQCPETMSLLSTVPAPVQAGRSPVAMFSLLKPKTRIPPHTGASNVRLVTHLPLIIPPDCGIRVGNTTRAWRIGEGFAFDDTIEHEAWNESAELRVVLIFDCWNPYLTDGERRLVTALSSAVNDFLGDEADVANI
jgi:aspartate beta-hydroxylase